MLDQYTELKNRVEARQKELEAQLAELKADTQESARAQVKQIESRLDRLRDAVQDGWDNLNEATVSRLNEWLKE